MSNTIYTCTGCIPIDKSIVDTYVALLSADKRVEEAEDSRQEAEGQGDYSDATQYPNTRRAKEAARQTAEANRVKNEGSDGPDSEGYSTSRIKMEIDRQSAETQRQTNEGIGATDTECAPGSRRKNESIRQANEETRQSQEETRQAQEGTPSDEASASGSRWARYKYAEAARQTSYETDEGEASDAASATGSRWARYNKAEADRETAYDTAEASRTAGMAPLAGYYGCSTAASTAAKEVAATNYVLTNGGTIKVKFTYANSASSPTLNINSTGAKAIVYNGAAASASNTWAAGDVVEFYYDPTYNSNAGAFVGIPTVVTVSQNTSTGHTDINIGSDSYPVASVEEVSQLGQETTIKDSYSSPLEDIDTFPGAIISSGKYRNQSGYTCHVIPVFAGQIISIKRGSTSAYWGLVKTYTVPTATGDTEPDYATGESARELPVSETNVTVPVDAKFAIIPVMVNSSNRQPSVLKNDGYDLFKGADKQISELFGKTKFLSGQEVNEASIVNGFTGGANNVLSGEQGKALVLDDYHFTHIVSSGGERITELDNLPIGTKIYRCYEDVSNENVFNGLRYYYTLNGASANKLILPSQTIVIGEMGETDGYFTNVNDQSSGNISVIINPRTDTANDALKYNSVGRKNLIGKNVVFSVTNRSVSTSAGTDIWGSGSNAIPKIPKGAIVHIDFESAFSSWLSRYRVYFNNEDTYTNIDVQKYAFVATTDIFAIRVRIANADILSGQTPPNINVEMWWEDVLMDIDFMKAKTTPLLALSKQAFIDANPSGYDSANDKFTSGEYLVALAPASNTVALMDIIANYTAKYTATGDAYPYLQMRYYYGSSWEFWWKYPIGGNGYYKANQCKLVCPGVETFSSPWNANIQIRIVVPSGCELYLKNINAEFSNSFVNKDAFKVFQHGTERKTTGADNKTNWDLWTHIGNYGAIVIPKRTTDGRWVCYHDDSFGDNPNVQVIGDPTAALPAASMQACTFAETQTLEYKAANFYGDHDTIPLLSEFFAKCAQMGVHPALSCHPVHNSELESSTWKYADWAEVKAMAKKYRVLDKLTIKSSFSADNLEPIQNFFAIFGNDIESYIGDVSSEPTQAAIEALAGIGWDLNKVKVGLELVATDAYFSDATIAIIEANNLVHGIAPGASGSFYKNAKNLKDIIDKGCYEITADQFYSNGLNWA